MYFQLFLMDKLLVSSLKITRNDYDLKKTDIKEILVRVLSLKVFTLISGLNKIAHPELLFKKKVLVLIKCSGWDSCRDYCFLLLRNPRELK